MLLFSSLNPEIFPLRDISCHQSRATWLRTSACVAAGSSVSELSLRIRWLWRRTSHEYLVRASLLAGCPEGIGPHESSNP